MTIVERSNPYGAINLVRLESLKIDYGLSLPDDYKSYLIQHNGGAFRPCFFNAGAVYGVTSLHHLYRVTTEDDYFDLIVRYRAMKTELPAGYIAVADDPAGNYILLGLNGMGGVYFLHHEFLDADPVFIAKTFDAFVGALFDYDEFDDAYDKIIRSNDVSGLSNLLATGFDVEWIDKYNHSILEKAVILDRPDAVRVILLKGPRIRNALQIARDNMDLFPGEYNEVFRLLSDYIKDPERQ